MSSRDERRTPPQDRPLGRREVLLGAGACLLAEPVAARHARKWDFGPTIYGKCYSYDEDGGSIRMRERDDGALEFTFPKSPGQVDYLTTGCNGLEDARSIRLVYDLQGRGKLKPVGDDEFPARVRLHFQRAGDNWSGRGEYEHYRFWSTAFSDLELGSDILLECQLDPELWTGVYGRTNRDGFSSARRNAARVGLTFGGMYAGHGVRAREGDVAFVLKEFRCADDPPRERNLIASRRRPRGGFFVPGRP
jgi:hypothetical protein